MSITSLIKRFSIDTAVYWGNPVADAYGGNTYDDPIEIKCRWDEKIKIINNLKGEEIISNAEIMTNEVLEEGGVVYLGTLSDLDELEIDVESGETYLMPHQIEEGAFKILTRDMIHMPRSVTQCVRIYYVKPNWETKQ